VLRLLDARTGSYAEVRPARPGVLRASVHVPESAGESDVTGLRVLLAADLLTRVAELRNLQVLTALGPGGQNAGTLEALERTAGTLGIHPPAARADPGDAPGALGGPVDVHLDSAGVSPDDRRSGIVTRIGAAHLSQPAARGAAVAGQVPSGLDYGPAAVRLALMSFPYHQPADLSEGVLAGARQTVRQWRRQVAEWAESPSRPVPGHIAEAVQVAFGDLDTVSLLALLHSLAADDEVPAGARFEAFLYADRALGLDLPAEIGHLAG
jgi:hypothetical protein